MRDSKTEAAIVPEVISSYDLSFLFYCAISSNFRILRKKFYFGWSQRANTDGPTDRQTLRDQGTEGPRRIDQRTYRWITCPSNQRPDVDQQSDGLTNRLTDRRADGSTDLPTGLPTDLPMGLPTERGKNKKIKILDRERTQLPRTM